MRKCEPIEEQVRCECQGVVTYVPKNLFNMVVLRTPYPEKKYVRYKDGCKMYGMSEREFHKLAHNAKAIYKVNKMALIKIELIDKYLEYFRLEQ